MKIGNNNNVIVQALLGIAKVAHFKIIKVFSWKVRHYTPKKWLTNIFKENIISRAPTQISYTERLLGVKHFVEQSN